MAIKVALSVLFLPFCNRNSLSLVSHSLLSLSPYSAFVNGGWALTKGGCWIKRGKKKTGGWSLNKSPAMQIWMCFLNAQHRAWHIFPLLLSFESSEIRKHDRKSSCSCLVHDIESIKVFKQNGGEFGVTERSIDEPWISVTKKIPYSFVRTRFLYPWFSIFHCYDRNGIVCES